MMVTTVPVRPRAGETPRMVMAETYSKVMGPVSGASASPKPGTMTVTLAMPVDGAPRVTQHAWSSDTLSTSHWTPPIRMAGVALRLSRAPLTHTSWPPATEPPVGLIDSTSADSASSEKRSAACAATPDASTESSVPAIPRALTPLAGGAIRHVAAVAFASRTTHSVSGSASADVRLSSKMGKLVESPRPTPVSSRIAPPAALKAMTVATIAASMTATAATLVAIVTWTDALPFARAYPRPGTSNSTATLPLKTGAVHPTWVSFHAATSHAAPPRCTEGAELPLENPLPVRRSVSPGASCAGWAASSSGVLASSNSNAAGDWVADSAGGIE
mmetsp:Transcript_10993/g.31979  ORF Transcript_10993/g.31979 Transcript_10993/m.31979 type:complete len:331 (+) Transcript_10993:459-1451(+)